MSIRTALLTSAKRAAARFGFDLWPHVKRGNYAMSVYSERSQRTVARVEIAPRLRFSFSARVAVGARGSDRMIGGHVEFAGLFVALSLDPSPHRLVRGYDDRETRVTLYWSEDSGDLLFWWRLWRKENEGSYRDPLDGTWNISNAIFGARKYTTRVVEPWREVRVPMPEGTYEASAKLYDGVWQRPRWPWPRIVRRVEIKIPKGIPVPGKGENAWDCGPDATYGMTTSARTIEEGIGRLVGSCLRTRRRRGESDSYAEREAA